jgi:Multiubiquitin
MSTTDAETTSERKTVTIVVNGEQKVVDKDRVTFDEVVDLAFNPRPVGQQIVYEITYWRGPGKKPEGHLVEGESVNVKDGMVFNVTYTDKS